jgi:hypothetical protein
VFQHDIEPAFFLLQTLLIDQGSEMTCPARTLAIYAHEDDIDYTNLPALIKAGNACKTKDCLSQLQITGQLPLSYR